MVGAVGGAAALAPEGGPTRAHAPRTSAAALAAARVRVRVRVRARARARVMVRVKKEAHPSSHTQA
jgi:hypothetical protein